VKTEVWHQKTASLVADTIDSIWFTRVLRYQIGDIRSGLCRLFVLQRLSGLRKPSCIVCCMPLHEFLSLRNGIDSFVPGILSCEI
jgi:hypothetical protein